MKEILVSTDIGSDIDDALSLLVMFNQGLNLKGIYTVNGDVDSRSYIAQHMVNLAKKRSVVGRGEALAIDNTIKPYSFADIEHCLIDDAFLDHEESELFGDYKHLPLEKIGVVLDGVKHMARQLEKGKHIVFSLAPLTNIAKLIQEYPHTIKNIEVLYIMGCRFVEEAHEHNVRFDPRAASIVLNANIPTIIVPGNLCNNYRMPIEYLDQLVTLAGRYVKRMARSFIGTKTAISIARSQIQNLLERQMMHYKEGTLGATHEEYIKIHKRRLRMVNELSDPFSGILETDEYFGMIKEIQDILRNPKIDDPKRDCLARILDMAIPTSLSVADVFVPYCFIHPERLTTERATVTLDDLGRSLKNLGNKHEIVTDLDFNHFDGFVKRYLY